MVLLPVITHLVTHGGGYLVSLQVCDIPPGCQIICAAEDPWISAISHTLPPLYVAGMEVSAHCLRLTCQANSLSLNTGGSKLRQTCCFSELLMQQSGPQFASGWQSQRLYFFFPLVQSTACAQTASLLSLHRRHPGSIKNNQKKTSQFYMAQSYLQEHEDPIDITQLLYVDISVFKEIFFLLY